MLPFPLQLPRQVNEMSAILRIQLFLGDNYNNNCNNRILGLVSLFHFFCIQEAKSYHFFFSFCYCFIKKILQKVYIYKKYYMEKIKLKGVIFVDGFMYLKCVPFQSYILFCYYMYFAKQ